MNRYRVIKTAKLLFLAGVGVAALGLGGCAYYPGFGNGYGGGYGYPGYAPAYGGYAAPAPVISGGLVLGGGYWGGDGGDGWGDGGDGGDRGWGGGGDEGGWHGGDH